MVRNRTYEELARRLGPIESIVAGIIERNGTATVLEIGAGSGIIMHQLHLKFADALEIYGLNRQFHHGNHQLSMEEGLEFGAFDERAAEFYERHRTPMYLCADAGAGLPFADDSFDFAYSQATIPFVRDKANLANEVNRVLRPGGSARIQVNLPPKFMLGDTDSLFKIESGGNVCSIEAFVDTIDGLTAMTSKAGVQYLEVEKRPQNPLNVAPVSFEYVGDPECPYIESVYRQIA